jgi:hypothetical protein
MKVPEFVSALVSMPEAQLRFELPSGEIVPPHFHITEVGRVEKRFIDCGGTERQTASCVLQAWTANDLDHRLTAGKLAKIVQMAAEVLDLHTLSVGVEYGNEIISLYHVESLDMAELAIHIKLVGKRTACLALDKCLVLSSCDPSEGCCG